MNIAIISYLYIVFFILAVLADQLPFSVIIKSITLLGINSVQTIRSKIIEDVVKGKTLLANSFGLFKQSLIMFAFIILIAVCGYVILLISILFKPLSSVILLKYVITLNGLMLSVISFFSYFLLKKLYVKIRL
ncbi:MAG TPA: hypothetical protein VIJ27_07220 [Mucilaginibacter sp.]